METANIKQLTINGESKDRGEGRSRVAVEKRKEVRNNKGEDDKYIGEKVFVDK